MDSGKKPPDPDPPPDLARELALVDSQLPPNRELPSSTPPSHVAAFVTVTDNAFALLDTAPELGQDAFVSPKPPRDREQRRHRSRKSSRREIVIATNGSYSSPCEPASCRMPNCCCVFRCPNTKATNPNLILFKLPTDPERFATWLRLIRREDLINKTPTNYKICASHFSGNDILQTKNRKILKKSSVPSRHLPTQFPTTEVLSTQDRLTQLEQGQVLPKQDQSIQENASQTTTGTFDRNTQTDQFRSSNIRRKRKLKIEISKCRKKIKFNEKNENEIDVFHKLCDKLLSKELAALVKAQTYFKLLNRGNRDAALTTPWVKPVRKEGWSPTKYSCLRLGTEEPASLTDQTSEEPSSELEIRMKEEIWHLKISEKKKDIKIKNLYNIIRHLKQKYGVRIEKPSSKSKPDADEGSAVSDRPIVYGKRRTGETHDGLYCYECRAGITGYRYKCVACPDYDLCGACEALGAHSQHMVMRISRPLKSKHANALLQHWCDSMKTAGISSLDKLTHESATLHTRTSSVHTASIAYTQRDGGPDDQGVTCQVLNHWPCVLKEEPEDVTETSSTYDNTTIAESEVNAAVTVEKTELESAKKKQVVHRVCEKEMEMEAASSERQTFINYLGLFGETEPTVAVDIVKAEEEDPLRSEMTQEHPQQKAIDNYSSHVLLRPSDCSQNRQEMVSGQPGTAVLIEQVGTALRQSEIVSEQSGTFTDQSGIVTDQIEIVFDPS